MWASPSIFRGTILENLTLFRPELSHRAHQVSKDLGLDRAINLLPEGFETKLGEGIADDLRASIAQQVCIARALVSDPAILILDEANTVLDRGAEANLARAIEQLRGPERLSSQLIGLHFWRWAICGFASRNPGSKMRICGSRGCAQMKSCRARNGAPHERSP